MAEYVSLHLCRTRTRPREAQYFCRDDVRNNLLLAPPRINRREAEKILLETNRNLSYVIRQSTSVDNCYAISMLSDKQIFHFLIEQRDSGFYIGLHQYPDIAAIVDYYSHYPLIMVNNDELCLGEPIYFDRPQ